MASSDKVEIVKIFAERKFSFSAGRDQIKLMTDAGRATIYFQFGSKGDLSNVTVVHLDRGVDKARSEEKTEATTPEKTP